MPHIRSRIPEQNNVINLFERRPLADPSQRQLIRLVPELDRLCMVYSHPHDTNSLFAVPLLGWAIRNNQEIVGVVPWLTRVIAADQADDPESGMWQGYYDPATERLFSSVPAHKQQELQASAKAYRFPDAEKPFILQEIPDTTGTHALTLIPEKNLYQLSEIYSWALFSDGRIEAMLVDEAGITNTPVLPGDPCLYPFSELEGKSYYFQYKVANQIKREEPEAMTALQRMMLGCQKSAGI